MPYCFSFGSLIICVVVHLSPCIGNWNFLFCDFSVQSIFLHCIIRPSLHWFVEVLCIFYTLTLGWFYVLCRSDTASVKKTKNTTLSVHKTKGQAFVSKQMSKMTTGRVIQFKAKPAVNKMWPSRSFLGHESSGRRKIRPAEKARFPNHIIYIPIVWGLCLCWERIPWGNRFAKVIGV